MGPNNIIIVLSKFGAIIPHGVLVGPQRSHSSLICRFLAVLVTLRHDILRQVFRIFVGNKKKLKIRRRSPDHMLFVYKQSRTPVRAD